MNTKIVKRHWRGITILALKLIPKISIEYIIHYWDLEYLGLSLPFANMILSYIELSYAIKCHFTFMCPVLK